MLLGALILLGACRSSEVGPSAPPALVATIHELYDAFSFDAGAEPDWATQRRIYLEGAVFVPPIRPGRAPVGEDTEAFLESFAELPRGEFGETGFHERIIGLRVDSFGGIAQAWVAFEGFRPGDGETLTRGLDGLQFVHDGEAWRLVSFTTQYEREGLVLPERFQSH